MAGRVAGGRSQKRRSGPVGSGATPTPEQDPPGPDAGYRRVLRGGGWSTSANLCRSALRGHNTLDARHNYNGFRVALSVTAL